MQHTAVLFMVPRVLLHIPNGFASQILHWHTDKEWVLLYVHPYSSFSTSLFPTKKNMVKHQDLGTESSEHNLYRLWSGRNLGRINKRTTPQEDSLFASLKYVPQIYNHQSQLNTALERIVVKYSRREWTHLPLEFWELLFVSSKLFCALPSALLLKALSAGWRTKQWWWLVNTGQGTITKGGRWHAPCAM